MQGVWSGRVLFARLELMSTQLQKVSGQLASPHKLLQKSVEHFFVWNTIMPLHLQGGLRKLFRPPPVFIANISEPLWTLTLQTPNQNSFPNAAVAHSGWLTLLLLIISSNDNHNVIIKWAKTRDLTLALLWVQNTHASSSYHRFPCWWRKRFESASIWQYMYSPLHDTRCVVKRKCSKGLCSFSI